MQNLASKRPIRLDGRHKSWDTSLTSQDNDSGIAMAESEERTTRLCRVPCPPPHMLHSKDPSVNNTPPTSGIEISRANSMRRMLINDNNGDNDMSMNVDSETQQTSIESTPKFASVS